MSVGVERKPKVGAQFAEHAVRGLVRHLPRKERAALMPRHMLPPPQNVTPPGAGPAPATHCPPQACGALPALIGGSGGCSGVRLLRQYLYFLY
jgi:hypothetical protein